MEFLLAGLSVRALAQSAVRAGYRVAAVDHFGDRDLAGLVPHRSLLRDLGAAFKAQALPGLAAGLDYQALAYVSNLENHPEVVRDLAGHRPVIGNSPEVLGRVRHWPTLRRVCAEQGLAMPETLFPGEETRAAPGLAWLRKPILSGGGHAIRPWDGLPLGPGWYVQAKVPGVDASAVFVANGRTSVVLGLCEQIIGDRRLGAKGFRHCGNVFPLAPDLGGTERMLAAVQDMADSLTRSFGLRGVCGLDFMVASGPDGAARPVLLEVNPRPTSSAELIEEAGLASIFAAHVQAMAGILPARPKHGPVREYLAKGIAFARQAMVLPEEEAWMTAGLRDVGYPGDAIAPGQPICSILTRGRDRREALENLFAAGRTLRRNLAGGAPGQAWPGPATAKHHDLPRGERLE